MTVAELHPGELFAIVVAAVCFAYFSLTILRLFWHSETVKQRIWLWLLAIPLIVLPVSLAIEVMFSVKIF